MPKLINIGGRRSTARKSIPFRLYRPPSEKSNSIQVFMDKSLANSAGFKAGDYFFIGKADEKGKIFGIEKVNKNYSGDTGRFYQSNSQKSKLIASFSIRDETYRETFFSNGRTTFVPLTYETKEPGLFIFRTEW